MATNLTELDALFDANPAAARGFAASYQALLGGVPTMAGFGFLIDTALDTNFGSLRTDIAFNEENIFINLTNNLVQGNAAAAARFDAMDGGATTLPGKIEAYYKALVPAEAQTQAGLAFLTRPEALQFYADAAAERGVGGTDGAAVVALASLLKILVQHDIGGLGDDVNDFIAAVGDGSARIGTEGLTDIDIADGAAHDDDEGMTPPVDAVAPTVSISAVNASIRAGGSTTVLLDFSEPITGLQLADLQATGGSLSNLAQSVDDPTLYIATFTAGSTAGPATITLSGLYQDLAGNAGSSDNVALTILPQISGGGDNGGGETPGNAAPVSNADSYAIAEGGVLTVATPGVLINDTDADGDALSAVLVSTTANGALVLSTNGSFTYTPNAGFSGADSFTYQVNDGKALGNVVTVRLAVGDVDINTAPVAVADSYTLDENTVLTTDAPGLLANDTDADGDALSAVLVSTTANGTLAFNANGSFTYTPNADFSGTDSFTYKVNDGTTDGNTVTVNLSIADIDENTAPVAVADSYTLPEDRLLAVNSPGVLENDADPDGDVLTAVLVSTTTNGALTLNEDGSFTYEPNANFFGTDSFTYVVNDGSADSTPATVTLTVEATGTPRPRVIDLANLGAAGVRIVGETANDNAGVSVSNAGDVNGDGIDDIIIGASGNDAGGSFAGAAYVVFGNPGGLPQSILLANIAANIGGFKIVGELPGDVAGQSVSAAGDINGDGIDDLIVGAPYSSAGGYTSGATYVVFGTSNAQPATVNLDNIANGTGLAGFRVVGTGGSGTIDGSQIGFSDSGAGDLDGDGIDDLIIGSGFERGGIGTANVIFGSDNGFPPSIDLEVPGETGIKFVGGGTADLARASVSNAGDVNGDGIDDIVIGTRYAEGTAVRSGAAYVVFGSTQELPEEIDLSDLGDLGFKISGRVENDGTGDAVSAAGDVNGDGFDDILVGSPGGGTTADAAYVLFGTNTGFAAEIDLGSLGSSGITITGVTGSEGVDVSSAGDVNGDGFDDILIGSIDEAYLIFGSAVLPSSINLNDVALGVGGFKIMDGSIGNGVGRAVSGAGDINNDGFDDILVGAPFDDASSTDAGAAYVIYGGDWIV